MLISMCYILGPLHNEVGKILHTILHQIEIPENIISHSDDAFTHNEYSKDHILYYENEHNHTFLDFLNRVLKTSDNENNTDNSVIVNFKIDKHIRNKEKLENRIVFISTLRNKIFKFQNKSIQKGFLYTILQPPQFT